MRRLVLPAALEVIAVGARNLQAEVPLFLDVVVPVQQAVVDGPAALGDGAHQGHLARAQLVEDRPDLRHLQAALEVVQHRIIGVIVGREEVGVRPAQAKDLLQVRAKGGEVVRRASLRPGVVGQRRDAAVLGDVGGRHAARLVEVVRHLADQAGVVRIRVEALDGGLGGL